MAQNKNLDIINQQELDLDKLNEQRRAWLWASSVVFFAIITLMFAREWIDHFESKTAWWFIVSCMLLISINWWYWTMRVIRRIIHHQIIEYQLLKGIIVDILEIKRDVKILGEINAPK